MGDTRHSNSSSNNKFNSNNNKICIIQEVNNRSHNNNSSSSKWEAGTSILDQQRNNTGLIIGPAEGIRINRAANILHNNNKI